VKENSAAQSNDGSLFRAFSSHSIQLNSSAPARAQRKSIYYLVKRSENALFPSSRQMGCDGDGATGIYDRPGPTHAASWPGEDARRSIETTPMVKT